MSLPDWMNILKATVLPKSPGGGARLKGLGIVIGVVIAAAAVFVLTRSLKHIDYNEVVAVVRNTDPWLIALAAMLVVTSYVSLTLYDLLALRTIGRPDVPYRIAALASFTSYPISHGVGAVSLVSPVIRYRIYSCNGLGVIDVANICFLTGLTFWMGNLTALGFGLFYGPDAISLIDHLSPQVNRWLAAALLLAVVSFVIWSWLAPRNIGIRQWPVRLPSGPMVLLQIVIGIFDLGAAALAMYVLIPASLNIGIFPPHRRLHRRDLARLREPYAGGHRRVRRNHIARAGRRRHGSADCCTADVSGLVSLPSFCPGTLPVRRRGRREKFARLTPLGDAYIGELSLSPTMPATISVRQRIRTGSVGSL